ncbi:MAG: YHS domain-containing protein [Gemmatimonadales bacterium]|jgi:YHS domain-containing protein|nr:YHS domain-containing protein [Gemmatimonadales bacterium]
MEQVKDPVCGMTIARGEAAGQTSREGRTYYFCSTECRQSFQANPERYASTTDEPPFTATDSMAAPKFGSAGSGGLELEGPPDTRRGG